MLEISKFFQNYKGIFQNVLTKWHYFGKIVMFALNKLNLFAGVAQLIERCLAKAKVTGLSPASRSTLFYDF